MGVDGSKQGWGGESNHRAPRDPSTLYSHQHGSAWACPCKWGRNALPTLSALTQQHLNYVIDKGSCCRAHAQLYLASY